MFTVEFEASTGKWVGICHRSWGSHVIVRRNTKEEAITAGTNALLMEEMLNSTNH
jgi:hypothetical protein